MNPELQTVVERLELVERQNRGWMTLALLALALSIGAFALAFVNRSPAPGTGPRARFEVVEANRFVLRDYNNAVAGGIEMLPDGSAQMVLGNRSTGGSAHLNVPRRGAPQFTLRGIDGHARFGADGSDHPALWLSADGRYSQVSLGTREAGDGELWIRDAQGRPRFHAP